MCLCFCFILKYHGVVILNSAFGKRKRNSFKNKNQTQMPVSMFVGSCSIVISALLLLNGTKNGPFDCRIGSISIKKSNLR